MSTRHIRQQQKISMAFPALSKRVDELTSAIIAWEGGAPIDAAAFDAVARAYNTDVLPEMTRFKARADEPDPEKRIYGTGMTAKVIDVWPN